MTTLELYRKHKKGEIGRDRFLYEVRRDNNLPWITNITSYDDAVKILKNKGIIRESVKTDPIVDNVNPYALKRAVHKILEKEKNLTNNSYVEALNKAAKKLKDSAAVKAEMFANAESVAKADAKLQTQEIKKANHKDKHNEMKKAKGQQAPKATSAPTKENKKTKKPKGVEVMKDKGVEGSEKIIKEISSYLKKKLTENSSYHDFHEGMEVETQHGLGIVKEINGGTLTVETKDGKLYDVQMNHAKHFAEKKKEQSEAIDVSAIGGHEGGMKLANKLIDAIEMYNALDPDQKQAEIDRLKADIPAELKVKFDELMNAIHDESNYPAQEEEEYLQENEFADEEEDFYDAEQNQPDYYINVSLRDASRAIEIYRDINIIPRGAVKLDGTDSYVIDDLEIAQELLNAFQEEDIEIIDTDVPAIDSEYDTDYDDGLDEAGYVIKNKKGVNVGSGKNYQQGVTQGKGLETNTGEQLTITDLSTGKETQL